MPIVKSRVGEIYFDRLGAGDTMITLLPQSSGPVGVASFLNGLSETFTVIRYDQLGTGKSSPITSPNGMTMTSRAGEVLALLDALELDHAILCSHSTGCGIGIATAVTYPDHVAGLALISPWSYADGHLTTMQNLRIAAARGLDPYRYAWFNSSLLFPPAYRRDHLTGFEEIADATKSSPQNADQISERLKAILAFDARPYLSTISCPTIVVTAGDDQLMPDWFGREIADGIRGAELIAFNDGGHMLPETRGTEVREKLNSFFGAHPQTGTPARSQRT